MEGDVALECKAYWCTKILSKEKTVESRRYPLPQELLGKKIWLIASGGEEGRNFVPDSVPANHPGLSVVGHVVFSKVIQYTTKEQWDEDADRHCVPTDTPYSWGDGSQDAIFGWEVVHSAALAKPLPNSKMRRQFRSLFVLEAAENKETQ